MKRIIYAALAVVAMVGCSNADEATSFATDGEVRISSSIATRTIGDTWEVDDEIGVYMTTNGGDFADLGVNVLYSTANTNGDFTSTTPLYYPASSVVDLLAYYPHSDATTAAGVYSVDVTDQTDQGAIDLMVATVTNQAKTTSAVDLTFDHKLSRIEVLLKAGNGLTEDELLGASVMLAGTDAEATVDLTTDAVTLAGSIAEIALESTDVDDTYQAIVIPQELSGVTLYFTTTNYGTFSASISTTAFTVGNEYIYTATLNATGVDLSSATISTWGEGDEADDKLDAELFMPDIELVDGTYEIYTAAGLQAFASIVNNSSTDISTLATRSIENTSIDQNLSANGKLINNIDLGSVCYEGANWTPIGNYSFRYIGKFDGNGCMVSGLYINTDSSNQGLFGYIGSGAAIQNLGVSGSVSGNSSTGGIVGHSSSGSSLTLCYNTGNVEGSGMYVGGVVGYAYSSLTSCYNTGYISGSASNLGGVVGYANVTLTSCYNTGKIEGANENVGGVVGQSYTSLISCYNMGDVSNLGLNVGGVVGYANYSSLTSCYNTGDIDGSNNRVGGVVGYILRSVNITSCYNTGDVFGSGSYVGGVVGDAEYSIDKCYVTSCYSLGAVSSTSSSYLGGVMGYNEYRNYGTTYSYYDNETVSNGIDDIYIYSPSGAVQGGDSGTNYCGLTTEQMKGDAATEGTLLYYLTDLSQGNSSAWVADTEPYINNGYPILSWQAATDND